MILTTLVISIASATDAADDPPPPPPPMIEATPPAPPPATVSAEAESGPEHGVGGVFAPAILPRGSMTIYAILGAPDIGGGYRQGFSMAELEVRLWFNYFAVSPVLEVGGKMSVYRRGILEFVPNLAIGLEANSGTRYIDKQNFGYVAVRPRAALITGIRFTETMTGLFTIDLPWAIPVTNGGAGGHFSPTMGFGVELQLGGKLSGLLLGALGLDVIKEPLGQTQVRPAWAIRLGLGYRLF